MTYTLRRTAPLVRPWFTDIPGPTKEQGPFQTRRRAAKAAYFVLVDNGAATKGEALALVAQLEAAAPGTSVAGYGYTFTIEQDTGQ